MAWIAAALLSNWHFLLGRELKYWFLVRWFLRNRQRRNGFWAVDVSVGTLAASSVCMATWIAAWKSSSSATILKSALRSASLFTEQMKRVHNASSKGSAMEAKSHVAAAWRMRAASSWMDSPGRRCMVVHPVLETFPDDETHWIKLHLHVRHDLIHCKIVDFPWRRFWGWEKPEPYGHLEQHELSWRWETATNNPSTAPK